MRVGIEPSAVVNATFTITSGLGPSVQTAAPEIFVDGKMISHGAMAAATFESSSVDIRAATADANVHWSVQRGNWTAGTGDIPLACGPRVAQGRVHVVLKSEIDSTNENESVLTIKAFASRVGELHSELRVLKLVFGKRSASLRVARSSLSFRQN